MMLPHMKKYRSQSCPLIIAWSLSEKLPSYISLSRASLLTQQKELFGSRQEKHNNNSIVTSLNLESQHVFFQQQHRKSQHDNDED